MEYFMPLDTLFPGHLWLQLRHVLDLLRATQKSHENQGQVCASPDNMLHGILCLPLITCLTCYAGPRGSRRSKMGSERPKIRSKRPTRQRQAAS